MDAARSRSSSVGAEPHEDGNPLDAVLDDGGGLATFPQLALQQWHSAPARRRSPADADRPRPVEARGRATNTRHRSELLHSFNLSVEGRAACRSPGALRARGSSVIGDRRRTRRRRNADDRRDPIVIAVSRTPGRGTWRRSAATTAQLRLRALATTSSARRRSAGRAETGSRRRRSRVPRPATRTRSRSRLRQVVEAVSRPDTAPAEAARADGGDRLASGCRSRLRIAPVRDAVSRAAWYGLGTLTPARGSREHVSATAAVSESEQHKMRPAHARDKQHRSERRGVDERRADVRLHEHEHDRHEAVAEDHAASAGSSRARALDENPRARGRTGPSRTRTAGT